MLNTIVCTKSGCSGNKFNVNTDNKKIIMTCDECKQIIGMYDVSDKNFAIAPTCSKCESEVFKAYRDTINNRVLFQCVECNSTPRYIFFDNEGVHINYEQIKLQKCEELIENLDERLEELENKLDSIDSKTDSLDNSLDYIYHWVADIKGKVDNL